MRALFFIFGFLGPVLALQAGSQAFSVPSENLADWTLLRVERTAFRKLNGFSLPAQAQMARSFHSVAVTVQLVTQPVIGEAPEDWPVLELGHAAVVLTRHGNIGQLTVVIGEESPQSLPFTFALDDEGRSVEILTIRLVHSDSGVSIALGTNSPGISYSTTASRPLDLIISAGANQQWDLLGLYGSWVVPDQIVAPSNRGGKAAGGDTLIAGLTSTDGKFPSDRVVGYIGLSTISTSKAKGAVSTAGVPSQATTLEIYSPPTVRLGRSAAVRSAMQVQIKN